MMPEGNYYAINPRAVSSKAGTGNLQVALQFDVTHYADITVEGGWKPIEQVERTMYLSCTDKAWPWTRDKLASIGFDGDFDEPGFDTEGFEVVMKINEYQGKKNEKWDLAGGGLPDKAESDHIRRLNAMWKNDMGSNKKHQQSRRPEKDIPF